MQNPESHDGALREIAWRILPGSRRPVVERMKEGRSTPVYRVRRGATTLYIRLAESAEASLAPEMLVHGLLRERGVRVPEVVHFEPRNEALERSLLVTTEVPGRPISAEHHGVDVNAVMLAAGRDLAVMHTIGVEGFGWIRRDRPDSTRLEAALPTLRTLAHEDVDKHLTSLQAFLASAEIAALSDAVTRGAQWLSTERAILAHGDLDATHIFQRDGEYSGIIDFGEIRGADPFYDLGHVALHDGETIPSPLLPSLLVGYGEVAVLPPDFESRIRLWSLLIGIRALARSAARPRGAYQDHLVRALRIGLAHLST